MDLPHIIFLFVAGIIGGIISTLAGGAAIITFPALLATGISPVFATTANTMGLTLANFLAAAYDRKRLPPLDRSFAAMVAISVLGALAGAALLVLTPERVFSALVPLLLGGATALFAYANRIGIWLRRRAEARGEVHGGIRIVTWLVPVSIYGGYFGVGVGVLLLGVLSVGTGGDYRSANVTKNLVIGCNSSAAALYFAAQGKIAWPQVLVLIAGTSIGGLLGARLAQIMPNQIARSFVVGFGALLTVVFAWRYWL